MGRFPARFARIDIDPAQLRRGATPAIPLIGDAAATLAIMRPDSRPSQAETGAEGAAATRRAAQSEIGERYRRTLKLLELVRDALPSAPIVCDSTQAAYAGNLCYGAPAPRTWFNAATGYGALGYGLPAAIGAAVGAGRPVVCIAGDGGLQFSLAELGAAVEERLPLILLVWDNRGYGEIKSYMIERGIEPVGVDLHTPDFVMIGRAYGAEALRMTELSALPRLLREAAGRRGPTVIVFDEAVVLG